ncbi:MAG TPA: PhnD/SsuA/transferrin family substrate-binding protein [Vicinamibacterales bacterium]|jgi:4,5-dihydroxyphthalate decarboxylase|nr:PhnD/SsuA/transferrin family substrate-binding protein [Vicinamibacterales bacterium]
MTRKRVQKKLAARGFSRRQFLCTAGAASLVAALPESAFSRAAAPSAPAIISAYPLADAQLSICLTDNVHTRPIIDGLVQVDGIDLMVSTAGPPELFWRQLNFAEFDISEMSCSSLVIAISQGDTRFTAIPVFATRSFFHTRTQVRANSGIEKPEDLKGKRVGVPEYQQTAALWTRAALQHEFGVSPLDLDWHMERPPESSHGGATGFKPPAGLKFQYIPQGESIRSMLAAGTLDAAVFGNANIPGVRNLFPDVRAEGARYYKKTGFFPVNHTVVFKREVAEKYPWAMRNVFKAFEAAKALVRRQTRDLSAVYFDLDVIPAAHQKALDLDPYPYGMAANRPLLQALTQYSFEQGLTPRVVDLKDVFHPATMEAPPG